MVMEITSGAARNPRLRFPRFLVLFLLLGISNTPIHARDALFISFGPEVNAYSRNGAALGTNCVFGMELDSRFSTGIKTGFFHNLDTIGVWNFQLLLRYYPVLLHSLLPVGDLFIQAESGGILAFEFGESYSTFSAGISAGWHKNLLRNWYVEPVVSLGFPYIWGLGITAGYRFPVNSADRREQ